MQVKKCGEFIFAFLKGTSLILLSSVDLHHTFFQKGCSRGARMIPQHDSNKAKKDSNKHNAYKNNNK